MNKHLSDTIWSAYLDGALEPTQQAAAEQHLARCSSCRADLEVHKALRRRLPRLAVLASAHTDPAAADRAWAIVRPRLSQRRTTFSRPLRRLAYGLGTAILVGLSVLGLLALFYPRVWSTQPEQPTLSIGPPETRAPLLTEAFTVTVELSPSSGMVDPDREGDCQVFFTLELHNAGPGVAANVRITNIVASLLTYVEDTASGDAVYDPGKNAIMWAGSLGPGMTHTISFTGRSSRLMAQRGLSFTNTTVIDDGLHAPFVRSFVINLAPCATSMPPCSPGPTATPCPTQTPEGLPTATPSPGRATSTPTPTPTPRVTIPPPATLRPGLTPTPSSRPTSTPTPIATATWTPAPPPTNTPAPPPTNTPAPPPTNTSTPTPTNTATPTLTFTPTFTPTATPRPVPRLTPTTPTGDS